MDFLLENWFSIILFGLMTYLVLYIFDYIPNSNEEEHIKETIKDTTHLEEMKVNGDIVKGMINETKSLIAIVENRIKSIPLPKATINDNNTDELTKINNRLRDLEQNFSGMEKLLEHLKKKALADLDMNIDITQLAPIYENEKVIEILSQKLKQYLMKENKEEENKEDRRKILDKEKIIKDKINDYEEDIQKQYQAHNQPIENNIEDDTEDITDINHQYYIPPAPILV